MKIWGITDVGLVRRENQDAYAVESRNGFDICVVCDGMGGAAAGKLASEIAVRAYREALGETLTEGMDLDAVQAAMAAAASRANRAIREEAARKLEYAGMGTTLVAAFLLRNTAVVINVGDSRAYHFSQQGVRQLSCDHSVVELMVQRGELTREQAKNYPGKNLITRAVGTEPQVEGDIYVQELKKDDCILLCSDGLSNEMADQEMLFEVAHGLKKSTCCERLLAIAKNRGAPDNVTVTLAVI